MPPTLQREAVRPTTRDRACAGALRSAADDTRSSIVQRAGKFLIHRIARANDRRRSGTRHGWVFDFGQRCLLRAWLECRICAFFGGDHKGDLAGRRVFSSVIIGQAEVVRRGRFDGHLLGVDSMRCCLLGSWHGRFWRYVGSGSGTRGLWSSCRDW